jgi:GT2 family glycosyltransferase
MLSIDVLIVLYNNKPQLAALIAGLGKITVPITVHFLDNNSIDGTPEHLMQLAEGLPLRIHFNRSLRNNGFANGVNLLAQQTAAEFMFVLNPDTELEPGCLEKLVARARAEPGIAICEARQWPREHPKTNDSATGETTWCSGAAVLIRRSAFEEVGGFDQRLFFMYCEDVDLSWRFWLKGWKCVYVRDAVVRHFTQDLTPGKRRTLENYFTFRNSLFLFYRFGSANQMHVVWQFLQKRFLSASYTLRSKILFAIALIDHIRYIPYLLQTRDIWSGRKHPWIRFEETSLSR